jgi:hypothetical protein
MFLTEERNILQSVVYGIKHILAVNTFTIAIDIIKNGSVLKTFKNAYVNKINSATDEKELGGVEKTLHREIEEFEALYDSLEKSNPKDKENINKARKKAEDWGKELNALIANKRKQLSLKENVEVELDDFEDELFWDL